MVCSSGMRLTTPEFAPASKLFALISGLGGTMTAISNQEAMRLAALGDLRKCIELSAEIGNLQIVDGADPELELGALYELSLEQETPPVILFRNIKGYTPDYRIVVNA